MVEEEDPDEVDPAEDEAGEDAEDEAEKIAERRLLNGAGQADDDLGNPVDARDEEEDDLKQSRLAVKPFHWWLPLFRYQNYTMHDEESVRLSFHSNVNKGQKSDFPAENE